MTKTHSKNTLTIFGVLLICSVIVLSGCGGGTTNDLYFDDVSQCDYACCINADCGSGETCYQNACMVTWTRTFGGTGDDVLESVKETSDGGYLAVGYSDSFSAGGRLQGYVMKLDSTGTEAWSDAIGGTGDEYFFEAVQDRSGILLISGSTNSFAPNRDSWTIKMDLSGSVLGSTFEDKAPFNAGEDRIFSIDNTADGGSVIAGYTKSTGAAFEQPLIIKYDSSLKREWWTSSGGLANMRAYSIRQTSDGGYILAGKYGAAAWIMKTDQSGAEEWSKTFGTDQEIFFAVRQLYSGGYIAVGSSVTYGTDGSSDIYVVRLDSAGTETWTYTYGGSRKDEAKSVLETSDRGLVIVGYSYSYVDPIQPDAVIIKLDRNGNKKWLRRYGTASEDYINCVSQASDGGLIFSGFTTVDVLNEEVDAWVFKTDPDGYVRDLSLVYSE